MNSTSSGNINDISNKNNIEEDIKPDYKIMIGIMTYNRKELLEKFATSFNEILNLDKMHVGIFDDCSSEYDEVFLRKIFKKVDYIHRNKQNLRADLNLVQVYKYFLNTDCDLLLNADADLLFNKDIYSVILEKFSKTDGIFSLFNTPMHPAVGETPDGIFVEKNHVGAAGVVTNKPLIKMIVDAKCGENKTGIDWDFSNLLKSKNIRILATKQSFCQHIGYYGQNSSRYFDFGEGFKIDSKINGQYIEDFAENIFCNEHLIVNLNKRFFNNLFNIIIAILHITKKHFFSKMKKKD